jgi:hypothetical protein
MNLDRGAIEKRLAKVRQAAIDADLSELGARFDNVAAMSAAQVASSVVGALTWLLNLPQHERESHAGITRQLEMIALNLKNLK